MTGQHAPIPTRALVADPVLAEQIRQCELMLSDTIPWMRANPERVDFDKWRSSCGTFGCLAGWHESRHAIESGEGDAAVGIPTSHLRWGAVFGGAYVGTLDDREASLRAHLATLYARAGVSA